MPARRISTDPGWFGLYALPGFLGSLFIAIGALGVGWFPLSAQVLQWNFIDFVQTETVGSGANPVIRSCWRRTNSASLVGGWC
jgi:hypothetical protein